MPNERESLMTENSENMEVDDILSSIKSILEEDENNKSVTPEVAESETNDSEVVSNDADDDIIELSDDMRIAQDDNEAEGDLADINQVEEGSPLDLAIDGLDSEEIKPLEQINSPTDMIELTADDIVSKTENVVEEEKVDVPQSEVAEEIAKDAEDAAVNEQIRESAEVTEVADDNMSIAVEESENHNETIDEVVVKSDDVGQNVEEATTDDNVKVSEIGADDAVDVSANIISNFAKMFANGNTVTKKQVVESPQIVGLGEGSKTLEDFVQDAVVKVIGKDIAEKWNDGADYRNIAEAEIKHQVKDWINDNLPVMIERIVKEEIARVIEKVGS